jgi:thioredoxin 2
VSPLVAEAGRQYAGRLKVVKLNVDQAPAISQRFGVQGIPLLVIIRSGVEVGRLVGAVPRAQLHGFVQQHLEPAGEPA